MKWRFINTGFNSGRFNMDYDLELARSIGSDEAVLRLYRWKPYCISLGANQSFDSVNLERAAADNIDIVKRPTGGRAILHSEEITYSVVLPVSFNVSARNIYREINLALLEGLKIYNPLLNKVEMEDRQPDFPQFYKEEKSKICFAVSAKSELKYDGKKLVGSAQRKIGNTILQHGSILCGSYHLKIVDYLNSDTNDSESIKAEMISTTTDLQTVLNEEIDYPELCCAIVNGFEKNYNVKFERFLNPEPETVL